MKKLIFNSINLVFIKFFKMLQIIIFWLTWRYVDSIEALSPMVEDINKIKLFFKIFFDGLFELKYIVVSIVLFLSLSGLFWKIKNIVKSTIKSTEKELTEKVDNLTEINSVTAKFAGITNRISRDFIYTQLDKKVLINSLLEGKYSVSLLQDFGFDREFIEDYSIEAKFRELESEINLKNKTDESNRDNQQVPD